MKATELIATGNGDDTLKAVDILIQDAITGEIGYAAGAGIDSHDRAHACGRLDALINLKTIIDETVAQAKRNK